LTPGRWRVTGNFERTCDDTAKVGSPRLSETNERQPRV
jgi:hypothetical protein